MNQGHPAIRHGDWLGATQANSLTSHGDPKAGEQAPKLVVLAEELAIQLKRLLEANQRTEAGLNRMGAPYLNADTPQPCKDPAATPPSVLGQIESLSADLRETVSRAHDNASRLDRVV